MMKRLSFRAIARVAVLALLTIVQTSHSFESKRPGTVHSNPIAVRRQSFVASRSVQTRSLPTSRKDEKKLSSTQLEASPSEFVTAIASSPIGAISVLAGIVLVHEAGHYLSARFYDITVEEFSIGFGPKLVGFEAFGNEFNLRALPLGGYVRFPQNYDIEKAEAQREEARKAFEQRRKDENWTALQSALNFATLGLWDAQRRQKRKRELEQQALNEEQKRRTSFLGRLFSGSKSSTIRKTDPEDFEIEYFDDPNLLQNRPWFQRAVVLSGGVIMNMVLAYTLYFGEINWGAGIPQPVFDSGVVVRQAPRPDGASVGILREGDVIVGVNGERVIMASPTPMAAQKQVSDVIGAIRQTPKGNPMSFQVKRSDQLVDLVITPSSSDGKQTIGVFLGPNFKEVKNMKSDDAVEAAKLAYRYLVQVFTQTLDGILSLIGNLVVGGGPPPGQSVSGPIGLIKTGTEVVSTRDVGAVALFAAALSVNLGVINALPLPALDGGQLVFVLAEAITGRKVDQRLQEGITSIFILFLLFVTVSTAFSDVGSILSGR